MTNEHMNADPRYEWLEKGAEFREDGKAAATPSWTVAN